MAKIDGIQLPADLSGSLGGTPEEAAKVFLSAASKGLAKVIADALVDAVGETIGDGAAPDWTKLIATSQKPLRGKMKATTASLASQPIACGC